MAANLFIYNNNNFTVHIDGLTDVVTMLHKMHKNLGNIAGVLTTWRAFTQNMVSSLIKHGEMTCGTRPGVLRSMTRLNTSTARLRLRGIYRIGDLPWTAPPTTKPMYARGDYYRSWKNHKHKDRCDHMISSNARSPRGAEFAMVNTSIKTAHETGYTNNSRIFFRKTVPARPVTNIFTNRLVDDLFVPVFLYRIFQGTGIKSIKDKRTSGVGQIIADAVRGDRYV